MVDEVQKHERLIEAWARAEGIALRADIGPVVWEDPQVATDYDSEATDPARSTPYRALAFAAHNEERAFRYYTHVAANAVDEASANTPRSWPARNWAMPPCFAPCAAAPGILNAKRTRRTPHRPRGHPLPGRPARGRREHGTVPG